MRLEIHKYAFILLLFSTAFASFECKAADKDVTLESQDEIHLRRKFSAENSLLVQQLIRDKGLDSDWAPTLLLAISPLLESISIEEANKFLANWEELPDPELTSLVKDFTKEILIPRIHALDVPLCDYGTSRDGKPKQNKRQVSSSFETNLKNLKELGDSLTKLEVCSTEILNAVSYWSHYKNSEDNGKLYYLVKENWIYPILVSDSLPDECKDKSPAFFFYKYISIKDFSKNFDSSGQFIGEMEWTASESRLLHQVANIIDAIRIRKEDTGIIDTSAIDLGLFFLRVPMVDALMAKAFCKVQPAVAYATYPLKKLMTQTSKFSITNFGNKMLLNVSAIFAKSSIRRATKIVGGRGLRLRIIEDVSEPAARQLLLGQNLTIRNLIELALRQNVNGNPLLWAITRCQEVMSQVRIMSSREFRRIVNSYDSSWIGNNAGLNSVYRIPDGKFIINEQVFLGEAAMTQSSHGYVFLRLYTEALSYGARPGKEYLRETLMRYGNTRLQDGLSKLFAIKFTQGSGYKTPLTFVLNEDKEVKLARAFVEALGRANRSLHEKFKGIELRSAANYYFGEGLHQISSKLNVAEGLSSFGKLKWGTGDPHAIIHQLPPDEAIQYLNEFYSWIK